MAIAKTVAVTGRRWFVGSFGNLSISPKQAVTLAAVASGNSVAFGDKMPAGIKIVGVKLKTGALGASTTLTIKAGETALVSAVSTASAVHSILPVDDVLLTEDTDLSLVIGGGAATGDVAFALLYEVVGTL